MKQITLSCVDALLVGKEILVAASNLLKTRVIARNVVCPWCGKAHKPNRKLAYGGVRSLRIECFACEKQFIATRWRRVFATRRAQVQRKTQAVVVLDLSQGEYAMPKTRRYTF